MDNFWIYAPVIAALTIFVLLRISKAGPTPAEQGATGSAGEASDPSPPPSVPSPLMSRFMSALPDPGVRQRLIARERTRFPGETESGLIERVLFTLEKDRT